MILKNKYKNVLFLIIYFIPLTVILYHYVVNDFSADHFLRYREQLQILVETHRLLSVILFIAVYFAIVITSAPFTVVMNLFAGYLFGSIFGALIADVAVSSGAFVLFLFSRSMVKKLRGRLYRLQIVETSSKKTVLMLLFFRLSPFFPAPGINMACGAFGVKAHIFVSTTLFGSFPLILIYTLIGRHFGSMNKISEIYDMKLIITLILFGLLSLLPLLKKNFRNLLLNKSSDRQSPGEDKGVRDLVNHLKL